MQKQTKKDEHTKKTANFHLILKRRLRYRSFLGMWLRIFQKIELIAAKKHPLKVFQQSCL